MTENKLLLFSVYSLGVKAEQHLHLILYLLYSITDDDCLFVLKLSQCECSVVSTSTFPLLTSTTSVV